MNRTGRSRASRLTPPLLVLLLLLLLLLGVVAGEERTPGTTALADPDVLQLRSFFDDVFGCRRHDGERGNSLQTGRTFGQKRIQFMMMPMIYNMGVMMTMMAVLTVISLNGLMIGVILLVLKLSTLFGKFYALWYSQRPSNGPSYGHSDYAPPQPVHVHLHNRGGPYEAHGPAYYDSRRAPGNGFPDESFYYRG